MNIFFIFVEKREWNFCFFLFEIKPIRHEYTPIRTERKPL